MPLIQTTIEFFISQGALSLIFTALLMLIYVIYKISKLNSLDEYNAGKYTVIWLGIAIPQILGLLVAQEYKENLSTHSIVLTVESCETYRNKAFTKDQKCVLEGRVIEEQNNVFLYRVNGQILSVKKCDISQIRIRNFIEYKDEFERLFESVSVYDVLFKKLDVSGSDASIRAQKS